jgi:flagellar protein FliT
MNTLATYETMSALSAQMVQAARANDWDRLVALEKDCAGLARHLEADVQRPALSETERARKVALIHQILDDDAEVRRHTEPWMEQVKQFLGAGARERGLRRAYGVQ